MVAGRRVSGGCKMFEYGYLSKPSSSQGWELVKKKVVVRDGNGWREESKTRRVGMKFI
jgi:hypothetical protein